jgi:uncharacterized protein (TIGR03067 family)
MCVFGTRGLQSLWAEEGQGLEGTWSVVYIEFAGRPMTELLGAELVLANGKKTFKMPSGVVEQGTYTLDPTRTPKQIDATTVGKAATAKGIYALDGATLKLCFSQLGKQRPKRFATAKDSDLLLMVLERVAPQAASTTMPVALTQPPERRNFRMGFTGFAHDTTLQAVTETRQFVRDNADIVAHHIEGVPWAEALKNQPFPEKLRQDWEGKKTATPPGGKVYLAVSPGRGELKVAEGGLPLPAELQGKTYDHPLVKKAFLNYCRRSLEFFKPDYLAIGIEVNEIYGAGVDKWRAYVALHTYVYQELKREHKDLPVFASFALHSMFKARGKMLSEYHQIMPYNDLVAVSFYPFFMREDAAAVLEWLTAQFDQFNKPYAIVETNEAAETLTLPSSRRVINGTPAKQAAYYETLLLLAQQRRFEFVISFIHRDYDALWEKIKGKAPELFMAWRDCGLVDEHGVKRPAYAVWRRYFDRLYRN